jgi:hypothetical protein
MNNTILPDEFIQDVECTPIARKSIAATEDEPRRELEVDHRLHIYMNRVTNAINERLANPLRLHALEEDRQPVAARQIVAYKMANGFPSIGRVVDYLASRGVSRFRTKITRNPKPDPNARVCLKELADRHPGWERECRHVAHVKKP